jgi:hypothetical protein
MSVKKLEVESIGLVAFYKRRGARNLRLSITHNGEVRVTLPMWAPYQSGIAFVQSKADWITAQRPVATLIAHGHQVGKAHHIHFDSGQGESISTRITGNEVRVLLPTGVRWDSPDAQESAQNAGIRALKKEASRLLPGRLDTIAKQHGYEYNSVAVKRLKGRWGSCSEQKDIVLNCFLMQLPWELIDYVLLHELAHTKVMAHGPVFWDEMRRVTPVVDKLRKAIKQHKPVL